MSTYKPPSPDRPEEELKAGDAFRESVIERADAGNPFPLWHG